VDPPETLARPDVRLTVDNPEDLAVARRVWEDLGSTESGVDLERIIDYLDRNPDVASLNSHLSDGTDEDVKRVRPFMYGDADQK
jgi:spore coat polysaccharide biosynthesis protein SpsF (cytidylyltransferase family)